MKVAEMFKKVLQEMSKEEIAEKQKELEQKLAEVKQEYQSADSSNRTKILQKMQSIKTKINSLKMIRPTEK